MDDVVEVREIWSKDSLSVELWKEAHARARKSIGNVLFVARDEGSLKGLRRSHGATSFITGFAAITPEQAHLFYDLGMKFRYAFLIQPSDEILAGIAPLVTEQLTIARRGEQPDENTEMPRVPDANLLRAGSEEQHPARRGAESGGRLSHHRA